MHVLTKKLKNQEGFTLLELLIVIVIIGILALIIVPGLASGPKRARDAQRKSDLRAVKNALETYYNDSNTYPAGASYAGLSSNLVTAYLPSMPADPKNTGVYVYTYQATAGPNGAGANCAATPCGSYVIQGHLENTTDSQKKAGTTDTYEVVGVN